VDYGAREFGGYFPLGISQETRWKFQAARVGALAAGCALLAACNTMSSVDSKYGVSASQRVVDKGEPVPKGGGKYRVGNPYTIAGRVYVPEENVNYVAEGVASFYADDFHGRFTANGEVFDMNSLSAAHPTLPLPSYVRVTNLKNNKSLVVRVNDRGPYAHDRIIDLSMKSAQLLGFHGHGLAKVRVEYVGKAPLAGSDDAKLAATLRQRNPREMVAMRAPESQQPQSQSEAPSVKPIQVAAAQPVAVRTAEPKFGAEIFDSRPMTQAVPGAVPRASVPEPQVRPAAVHKMELAAIQAPAPKAPPKAEVAASSQPVERLTSPVSAYAPVRYDAPAGFMSGRGLY